MSNKVDYDLDIDLSGITLDLDDVSGTSDPSTFTITLPDDELISYNPAYNTTSDYQFDFNYNPGIDITQGNLTVHNEGDIKLGDRSLKEFMDKVEERMNILQPNPELEAQWDELKQLGKLYRKLEQELLEKNKMWETLKKE